MNNPLILAILVILIILAVGSLPTWPYSRSWSYGYYPSGVAVTILIVILVLFLLGRF